VAAKCEQFAFRVAQWQAVRPKPHREAETAPLLERLNIQRYGLHAFRHFAASMTDRLNTPLKLRQQRLGHSDAEMTLGVYSHVAKEDDIRVAAQLGEILDPHCSREQKTCNRVVPDA
jgi:integrase